MKPAYCSGNHAPAATPDRLILIVALSILIVAPYLNMNLNTSDATGKLMLTVIGAVGAWEREMMLERQREGIRKAVEAKKYKGRKPTARAKADEINTLRQQGVGPTEIAKRLGIGRASVYRILSRGVD